MLLVWTLTSLNWNEHQSFKAMHKYWLLKIWCPRINWWKVSFDAIIWTLHKVFPMGAHYICDAYHAWIRKSAMSSSMTNKCWVTWSLTWYQRHTHISDLDIIDDKLHVLREVEIGHLKEQWVAEESVATCSVDLTDTHRNAHTILHLCTPLLKLYIIFGFHSHIAMKIHVVRQLIRSSDMHL